MTELVLTVGLLYLLLMAVGTWAVRKQREMRATEDATNATNRQGD